MALGRNQAMSLVEDFSEIEEFVNRLGCRLRSDIEAIHQLEANFLDELKTLENLEQRVLFIEKNLNRDKATIIVTEEGQVTSDSGSSFPVEGKASKEDEDSVELLSTSRLTSDTERHLKLEEKSELLECRQPEWEREKEELLKRQTELEEEIRTLREQLSTLSTARQTETARRRNAANKVDIVDKTLFPVVVQCFVALREVSQMRRIESSCLLIQRIFRGYVVRKNTPQLKHRRTKLRPIVKGTEESVFITNDDRIPTTTTTTTTTGLITSGQEHTSQPLTTTAAEDDYDDDVGNNNRAKDVDVIVALDVNRSKLRKGSLPKLLQTTKVRTSSSSLQANRRSWSVSGTTEWQDPTDTVVHGLRELKQLELFFAAKMEKLNENSSGKSSVYDVVFAEALKKFHSCLSSSSAEKEIPDRGYKDLMKSFERELRTRAEQQLESSEGFPYPLFVNAFRGFIDEFIRKKHNRELPDIKTKKDQQKTNRPKKSSENSVGVCVDALSSGGAGFSLLDSSECLIFVDQLISVIESKGLSVVGLYRVAGNAQKIKQLVKDMTTTAAGASPSSSSSSSHHHLVSFNERDLHVLTNVLKAIFRDMPQPLITFDNYEDFPQLPDAAEEQKHQAAVDTAISKLPEPNRKLLNRLITHLAKVAQHESSNRMSANALAIVFAPCLMRRPPNQQQTLQLLQLNESLNDIQRQTTCLQFMIESELKKMKKDSGSLTSPDTDTTSVTDIDIVMLDDIDVSSEAGATSVSGSDSVSVTDTVTYNATVDVTDDVFRVSRIIDTDTSDNDAITRGIVSSTVEVDSGPHLNVVDSALTTNIDSANEADNVNVLKQLSVAENTSTTVAESLSLISGDADNEKWETVDGNESDLDFNVNVEDEDGDLNQPDDLNEGQRSRTVADDNRHLKVTVQPIDQSDGQTRERVEDVETSLADRGQETTNKNLEWSEDSSKDLPKEQKKNWSSAESPADGASSAPSVN